MSGEHVLTRELRLRLPIERVFEFFAAAENLAVITPPELGFVIATPTPIAMHEGTLIDYTIRLWGVPLKWRTRIARWDPPRSFVDEQLRGPYRQWIHTHTFEAAGDETVIRDEVRYILPFGLIGLFALPLIRRQLKRIFDYRQEVVAKVLLTR